MARYWCKVCSLFVDDTKLGRKLHEKTGRHQKGVQDQLRALHEENKKQDIAKKQEEKALKIIEKSIGLSSTKSSESSNNVSSNENTGLKLINQIAKVDPSKTIDPTPLEQKKRPQIHKEHEFEKFQIEEKSFEGHESDILSFNGLDKQNTDPIIKQESAKPLFKKRKINKK